ncbi:protein DEFECTIVE IN EXINE FORMATION 1-like [Pecten maximus]|uniref:protein DEFECTIVE IN EXINE FORMATION 1-like n=1 Tax=Pecten maximus TaxID=6579 RepID=UPI0014580964|nr:protein DEFECTIVE IN EXINE FORMATION 1-like [Pecten maximus]
MESCRIFIFSLLLLTGVIADEHLASQLKAEGYERTRCGYSLTTLWTAELAHSPFASAPLIADVNGDGSLDIVATPFSESMSVIDAQTGKVLSDSKWPALNLDSSIYASPLQFDADADGMLDLLFTKSSGELLFYKPDGSRFKHKRYQVAPVYVSRDWHRDMISVHHNDIDKYILIDPQSVQGDQYIAVDPHILATPVLADLNSDGRLEELVIPVSYFYEEEDYRFPQQLEKHKMTNFTDLERYVVAGVTVVNLTSLTPLWTKVLDLTQVVSVFPAYNLFSPTVADLDSEGGTLEIVMGTSAGRVYVFDHLGGTRKGWPMTVNSVHGQITVADITGDDRLDMVVVDTGGNVLCFGADGDTIWEAEISGNSSPGSRLYDLNEDSTVDVIITTNDGNIFALDGKNGSILSGWPIRTGRKLKADVLIAKLSTRIIAPDLVYLTDDGSLHIISTSLECKTHYPLGESSLVQILSHNLVDKAEGVELLIATNDGTILCLGSEIEVEDPFAGIDEEKTRETHLLSLPSNVKTPNDFSFAQNKLGVYVTWFTKSEGEVTGGKFTVQFEIIDPTGNTNNVYKIKIYYGSNLLFSDEYNLPGEYSVIVPVWEEPRLGHVTVMMTNQHGQIFQDSYPLRFNTLVMEDLQWLLMAPFIAMVVILLVIHGFPAKDLLPYTNQSKGS